MSLRLDEPCTCGWVFRGFHLCAAQQPEPEPEPEPKPEPEPEPEPEPSFQKPPNRPSRRGENLRDRGHRVDVRDVLIRYYSDQMVKDIAVDLGTHRSTISRILTSQGVDRDLRRGGPRKRPECKRGHPFEGNTYDVKDRDGVTRRGCRECKRERDRISARKRREERVDNG